MIPTNPSVNTTTSTPAAHPATPEATPAHPPQNPLLPPVKGSLPYTRDVYEGLPSDEKTPELDFLILGKIPGGKQNPSEAPAPVHPDFEHTVQCCLVAGETEALNFLWRESGRDPGKTTVNLSTMVMDKEAVNALVKHCADQKGLTVDLSLRPDDVDVIREVSALIAEGKVNSLWLYELSAGQLEQLAPVLGAVGAELAICSSEISERCEQQLAQSLALSGSLRTLGLLNCDFGDAQGKHFVAGMLNNHTIANLEMSETDLPTVPDGGYGRLLSGNPALRTLKIVQGILNPEIDIDALISGASNNHVLETLRVQAPACKLKNPEKLCGLLETNRTLTALVLPVGFMSKESYTAVMASVMKNISLTTFDIIDTQVSEEDFTVAVDGLMSRNRALANDRNYLQKAGGAFDPHRMSGLSDPGVLIAGQIFTNSWSRQQFETILTETELSLRELEKQKKAAAEQSASTTTSTLDDTAITTTTTATTNTVPQQGGSSS